MSFRSIAQQLTPPLVWSLLRRGLSASNRRETGTVLRAVRGIPILMDVEHALARHAEEYPLYDTAPSELAAFLVGRMGRTIAIIDVGANIGAMARFVASAVGADRARFLCIEADDQYIPFLRANTTGLEATIIEAVCGQSSGVAPVRALATGVGTSGMQEDDRSRHPMVRLDDLGWEDADILKIDTDGFEREVLKGGPATLSTVEALFIEVAPRRLRQFGKCGPLDLLDAVRAGGFDAALAYDNFGVPMGVFRGAELTNLCVYVDLQRSLYLDLLFVREDHALREFAQREIERAKSVLRHLPSR